MIPRILVPLDARPPAAGSDASPWLDINVKRPEQLALVVVDKIIDVAHRSRQLIRIRGSHVFRYVNSLLRKAQKIRLELGLVPDLTQSLFGYLLCHTVR